MSPRGCYCEPLSRPRQCHPQSPIRRSYPPVHTKFQASTQNKHVDHWRTSARKQCRATVLVRWRVHRIRRCAMIADHQQRSGAKIQAATDRRITTVVSDPSAQQTRKSKPQRVFLANRRCTLLTRIEDHERTIECLVPDRSWSLRLSAAVSSASTASSDIDNSEVGSNVVQPATSVNAAVLPFPGQHQQDKPDKHDYNRTTEIALTADQHPTFRRRNCQSGSNR